MIGIARAAAGIILSLLIWGCSTPQGWLAMLCLALLLHGAAVAIRAAFTAC